MGARTAVTDADGQYRFTAVPPGDYTLLFELSGFASVRNEGIRISLGFTATVNAEMKVASLNENVVVTGQSPVVDTSADAGRHDLRRQAAVRAADLARLLLAAGRIAGGADEPHRRRRQHQRHPAGLRRLRHDRPGARQHRGASTPPRRRARSATIPTSARWKNRRSTPRRTPPRPRPRACSRSSSASRAATSSAARISAATRPRSWQSRNIDDDQLARGLQGGGGIDAHDVNRLSSYQDTNIGFGGYAIKDKLWWYGSYRHQDVKARFVNFPVKPQTTILNNYSAKVTYNLSQNNKLIGYTQPSQKKQPQRFDSFLLGVDTGINTSEATTWNQNFWAWVHKAEWNGVLNDNAFAEMRGGQYGYDWDNGVNGTGLRYEDIGNNLIFGRNRNWARERRRNQVLGIGEPVQGHRGRRAQPQVRRRGLLRDRERHLHRRLRRGHRARDAEQRAARHHLLPGAEPVAERPVDLWHATPTTPGA